MSIYNPGGYPATMTSLAGRCVWSGWAGTTTVAKTLSVTAAATESVSGIGTVTNALTYTLDGSTWINFFSSSAAVASAVFSVAVPVGTNLANVQVSASSFSSTQNSGSLSNRASGTITVSSLQIA